MGIFPLRILWKWFLVFFVEKNHNIWYHQSYIGIQSPNEVKNNGKNHDAPL